MSHTCYLGVGSNIDAATHIDAGLEELSKNFELLAVSRVYESEAIGFAGNPFLNLVACIRTSQSLDALSACLRGIEYDYGRDEHCTKFSPRTLDIDLLTFDDLEGNQHGIVLPRPECTTNAFVLWPFSEIAPDLVLPGQSQCLAELWRGYNAPQKITPANIRWRNLPLPVMRNTTNLANSS